MTELFNKYREKEKRRYLRKNMTRAEKHLWQELRNRKIQNQRFLRQFSIGSYVLDFYCPNLRLAIEVDGVTHNTNDEIEYDKQRQAEIENLGIVFLRFYNDEIFKDINKVIKKIEKKIEDIF